MPSPTVVGSEARYDERLALPGFHVHLRDPDQVIPPASIHFDLQFELIDWQPDRRRRRPRAALADAGHRAAGRRRRPDGLEHQPDGDRGDDGRGAARPHVCQPPRDAPSLHARPPRGSFRSPAPPDGAGARSAAHATSASPCRRTRCRSTASGSSTGRAMFPSGRFRRRPPRHTFSRRLSPTACVVLSVLPGRTCERMASARRTWNGGLTDARGTAGACIVVDAV